MDEMTVDRDTLLVVCARIRRELADVKTQKEEFKEKFGAGPHFGRLIEAERMGVRRALLVVYGVYKEARGGEEIWACWECLLPYTPKEVGLRVVDDEVDGKTVGVVRGDCPSCKRLTGWELIK